MTETQTNDNENEQIVNFGRAGEWFNNALSAQNAALQVIGEKADEYVGESLKAITVVSEDSLRVLGVATGFIHYYYEDGMSFQGAVLATSTQFVAEAAGWLRSRLGYRRRDHAPGWRRRGGRKCSGRRRSVPAQVQDNVEISRQASALGTG